MEQTKIKNPKEAEKLMSEIAKGNKELIIREQTKTTKWLNKKEIKNKDIVLLTIISILAGFIWAYLHWGLGIRW